MTWWQVALWGLAAVQAVLVAVWVGSVVRSDASLVDRFWGLLFVVLVWVYTVLGDGDGTRGAIAVVLVTIWGLRLAGYITWRNWGEGEDGRYARMRARAPGSFAGRSLVSVFLLQGLLAWIVALPLLAVATRSTPAAPTWLDVLAGVVWLVGFAFEAGGDWQLSRFLADPANRGKVMDRGLWGWTRHPNYFGDATVWMGFGLLGLATGAWWSLVGPILMTVLILEVSGVVLTDRVMAEGSRREGHEEYVRRTNAFIPGPRRA